MQSRSAVTTACLKQPPDRQCLQAQGLARNLDQEWFYCKSSGHDTTRSTHKRLPLQNQLEDADYSEEEGAVQQGRHSRQEAAPKRQRQGSASAQSLDSLQEVEPDEPPKRRNPPAQRSAPAKAAPGALLGGRVCVQCNATQTPQWREGPAGPKTLCNACGVRYCRLQQRSNKKPAGSGAKGSGGGATKPARPLKGWKEADQGSSGLGSMDTSGNTHAGDLAAVRPVRQAALLSATRTAEYARTGVFPTSGSLRGEDRADECAAASAAQQQQRAGQWDHRDQEHLEEEEPEGEEAEDEGGGDSYAAAVAAVDTVARISSGSEPISPHRPSPHNHPQITHNADTVPASERSSHQQRTPAAGADLKSKPGGAPLAVAVAVTPSHAAAQGAGMQARERLAGSGGQQQQQQQQHPQNGKHVDSHSSPDDAFDSIDAMLLLAGAGGRNAAADAAVFESGSGSPLTASELHELMMLAALGGPMGHISCGPSPASACTGGRGEAAGLEPSRAGGRHSAEGKQQQQRGDMPTGSTGFTGFTGSHEDALTPGASADRRGNEDDNHFSLSACAEEDFCPHFDVDTYQSVFFAPPFDTLKAAALPEDALVRLHTVGDSAPEVLAPLCSMPRASSAVLHPEAVHATNTCSTAAAAAAAAGPPAAESSAPPVPAPSSGRPSLAPATAAAAAAAAGTQQEHDSTRLPTTLAAAGAREADDADQATHASSGPCPVGIAARRVGGEAEDAGCAHHVSSRTR
ncbi:MAG: hypothetical protein WDW36_004284 [Sanguina aurantia]